MNIPFKPRQYCGQSTEVPWAKYGSTLGKVLKYFGQSTEERFHVIFQMANCAGSRFPRNCRI